MSLFRRNGDSLTFVILRVYQEELEPLEKMIIDNGGAVRRIDNNEGIIFTQACNYDKLIWPNRNKTLIYDIRFIKECVRKGKIVDPAPYSLRPTPVNFQCVMTHFLYGGCHCPRPGRISSAVSLPTGRNRQSVVQTQSQTSSVTEDVFFTPIDEMSESAAAIANPTGNTQDPLGSPLRVERSNSDASSGSPIIGSPAIVRQRGATNHLMQLSSGDDRPTEALDEMEKRPCSLEYHTQVEPKLNVVVQRRKKLASSLGFVSQKRQQRTPTTLTDTHDTPNVVSATENKSINIDDVTRSAPSGENGDASVVNAAESADASYVVKIEPNDTSPSPAKSDASTIVDANSQSLSRKRLHSETAPTESAPESNWIVTDDIWMKNDANTFVSKYFRCNDGERRLLKESQQLSPRRPEKPLHSSTFNETSTPAKKKSSLVINKFSINYKQSLQSPTKTKPKTTKDAERSDNFPARVDCTSSASDVSEDDDILITKAPMTRRKVSVLSSDSEIESVNKPGPSGTSKYSRASSRAATDDSSSDDQDDNFVPKEASRPRESCRSENTCDKIKSANCTNLPRIKVRRQSDLESLDSIDDSRAPEARQKIKETNKSSEKYNHSSRNGRTRSPSIETVECDSDSSDDENTNSRPTIGRTKKPIKQSKQSKHATRSWNRRKGICISSDNDSDNNLSSHELHGADVRNESRVTRTNANNRVNCISSDDSDTSASSHPLDGKLSEVERAAARDRESGHRSWYTDSERQQMIRYIVDKEAFSLCSDQKFFESMASKKVFRHRSAGSLYLEFRKILKNIDDYATLFKLTPRTVRQFKKLNGRIE